MLDFIDNYFNEILCCLIVFLILFNSFLFIFFNRKIPCWKCRHLNVNNNYCKKFRRYVKNLNSKCFKDLY